MEAGTTNHLYMAAAGTRSVHIREFSSLLYANLGGLYTAINPVDNVPTCSCGRIIIIMFTALCLFRHAWMKKGEGFTI